MNHSQVFKRILLNVIMVATATFNCACSGDLTVPLESHPTLHSVLADERASWAEKQAYTLSVLLNDPLWAKKWWISKSARLLRGGEGLTPADDINHLATLPEEQIVEQFMHDARFGDTVLDFNMYFLGFKENTLRDRDDGYSRAAFDSFSAVASAQEVMRDGDYFKIFDFSGPFFLARQKGAAPDASDASEAGLEPEQVLRKRLGDTLAHVKGWIAEISKNPELQANVLCSEIEKQVELDRKKVSALGLNSLIFVRAFNYSIYGGIQQKCKGEHAPAARDLLEPLQKLHDFEEAIFAEVLTHAASIYNPRDILAMKPFNLQKVAFKGPWLQFGENQVQVLTNSSTNFNRKRAAYILKHFMCDDLNPVGFEDPGQHSPGDIHAADPACMSCHYKLDPMAGFFRNYGQSFKDFGGQKNITFDDRAQENLTSYAAHWKAPVDFGREWNVGYIRSQGQPQLNDYGESLEDLTRIARTAPEAKRCIVKRLFEYFVAEDQAIDGAYLESLVNQFTEDAKLNSSQALKKAIARLTVSQAFRTPNPDPTHCYDSGSSGNSENSPPCRVAFLLEKNCKSCHDSTGAEGSLDLTHWITLGDGVQSFPHWDDSGGQVPAQVTFQRLITRLTTSDPMDRMPKKRFMSSQDRQDLVLWAQGMAQQHSQSSGPGGR